MRCMEDIKRVGKNVYAFRTLKGISQRELSEKCGISRQKVSTIELGHYNCRLEDVFRIAQVLGVPFKALIYSSVWELYPELNHSN